VIGMVTRIAEQKGFDLIENIFDDLMKKELQLIVLGKGTKDYEDFLRKQAKKYPDKFFLKTEFDEEFAHQIYAGSDIFLMPSAFEPCGLGQMIAMRYGAIPVVRAVGGLKDTVEQVSGTTGTGFLFKKYDSGEFMKEIEKSLLLLKKEIACNKIQLNCMKKDFSWKASAKKYLEIYR
jgi:starch synthase